MELTQSSTHSSCTSVEHPSFSCCASVFWAKEKQILCKIYTDLWKIYSSMETILSIKYSDNRTIQFGGTGSDHLVQLPHQFRADWQICEPAEEVLCQIRNFEHQGKSFWVCCSYITLRNCVPMSYFTYYEIIEIVLFFQHFSFYGYKLIQQSIPSLHLLTLSHKLRLSISQNSSIHFFLLLKSLEGSGNAALAVEMLEGFILA